MSEQYAVTSPPSRRVVASFPTYEQAQKVVDYLSDEKFPVERVAIVGEGLRFVEQITGRLTWWKAALGGLLGGMMTGFFLGWLFGVFNLPNPLVSVMTFALWGLILGGVTGTLAWVIGYAATGGRRDFTSVDTIQAEHYSVLVDADIADEAQRLLARLPM
jgi:heat induced stress protein YflT